MSLVRIQSPRPTSTKTVIAIPLHTRRQQRGLFLQKLQHAIPSVVVLGDGLAHLDHDPHGLSLILGIAEIVSSLLVIGTVVRGVRPGDDA